MKPTVGRASPGLFIPLLATALRSDNGVQEALNYGGSRSCTPKELSGQSTAITGRFAGQCKHGQSAS